MEILEAYKVIPPSGKTARIYEFKGRRYWCVETTNDAGQLVKKAKRGEIKYTYVAAENLYDAVAHLRACRPKFVVSKVLFRGKISIEKQNENPLGNT